MLLMHLEVYPFPNGVSYQSDTFCITDLTNTFVSFIRNSFAG